jgi:hypothetical protein
MEENLIPKENYPNLSSQPEIKEEITSLDFLGISPPGKKKPKIFAIFGVLFFLFFSLGIGVYVVKFKKEEVRTKAGTGSECFEPPRVYKPAPYPYRLGDTHSPDSIDWVVYPIKPECANVSKLTEIFGPLDKIFPDKEVYITRPNQPFQYGFTFNRIIHIDGYNDVEIQAGYPEFTEQQLHELHYQGKDVQSIEDCDKNGRQVVFDLTGENPYGKVAKPNGWVAWKAGYYQFDLTPKFRCEGGAIHQESLGAGFIRVIEEELSCQRIRVYNSSWQEVPQEQLDSLKPGDQVYLSVLGSTRNIDKARFRINGGEWQETTSKKETTGEFYISYIIPTGVTNFRIEAEVHHPTLGWK